MKRIRADLRPKWFVLVHQISMPQITFSPTIPGDISIIGNHLKARVDVWVNFPQILHPFFGAQLLSAQM